ncbi:replication initiator protein [Peromfec virus RodF7_7]|uniref:Replication initiator protein n=1 Tax=Peromfec virus RodF7_7 TaxID=2929355 RepID=A0A976R5J4_9VIRU|nr:replication initiator protein [Peromfec virus RodF7_7]
MRYEQQTRCESDRAKFSIFATLTYSPEHLPTLAIDIESRLCGDATVNLLARTLRVAEYYDSDVVATFDYPYLDVDKYLRPFKFSKFKLPEDNTFGFLFYPDIQKYNKLLKYYMKEYISAQKFHNKYRKLNEEQKATVSAMVQTSRFFCIGEYGPKTFRPHWHFLYFCDSALVSEALFASIPEAWSYGRIDRQYTNGGADSYVSSYLNANSSLPKVIVDSFPCKVRHSVHYGFKAYKQHGFTPKQVDFETLRSRSLTYGGRVHELSIPSALETALFPQCYRFGTSDDVCKLRRYQCYRAFCEEYGRISVEEMIKLYFAKEYRNPYFSNLYNEDILLCHSDKPESTLRTMLYTSKRFLEICDEENMSPEYYLTLIKKYYNDKTTHQLSSFYTTLQEEYMTVPAEEQINEYTNVLRLEPWRYMWSKKDTPEWRDLISHSTSLLARFCDAPLTTMMYQVGNQRRSRVLAEKFRKSERYCKDRVKHKEQNDLNKFFVYE